MEKEGSLSTCILGIGNTLRGDDGLGIFVCNELEKHRLPGVEIRVAHQLHIEMVSELQSFQRVILVDAAYEGENVSLYRLKEQIQSGHPNSHNIDAYLLVQLSNTLFPETPDYFLCAVKGTEFDFKESLSEAAVNNAMEAVKVIRSFLTTGQINFW